MSTKNVRVLVHSTSMEEDEDEPLFTIVFDREAYSPEFFDMLWRKYRIAIITYRKNVKDKWDEALFEPHQVPTTFEVEKMKLREQTFRTPDGKYSMREVRRLCDDGHQTSVVTTNKKLSITEVASHMFARWSQENFFRYMRQDYAFDKIIEYSIDELDKDMMVVNPEYNTCTVYEVRGKVDYKIKKEREKLGRRKAKFYELNQKNPLEEKNQNENKKWMKEKLKITEDIERIEQEIERLLKQRSGTPYKISIGQMPEYKRYNMLNQESRRVQNIIKIICYRAETALAALLSPHYKRTEDEIRMLVKAIINTPIDMEVDNENEELKITLYPLANQRCNQAVSKICQTVNQTNTIYPGTNLRINYKIATF